MKVLLGQTLSYKNNPFVNSIETSARHLKHGALVIDKGLIVDVGEKNHILKKFPNSEIFDYQDHLITAGFIDCHMHYPQTQIIASYGKRLLDWLNNFTFPEEMKFSDIKYASKIASITLDLCLANGTTTLASYCTIHPESVDVFFYEAEKRKMSVIAGKTCMDRNAPKNLLDTPKSAYVDSEKLIKKWHNNGRAIYAISPRFAPTSSPEQLEILGELWKSHPDCLMQTHISEQKEEMDWVQKLFPNSKDYLDVYERFNLIGEGAVFGHAVHLNLRERKRILETKSAIAHCPTSNMFIGSGIFDLQGMINEDNIVGLASDTGGGSSFSMLRTMAATYELAQLKGFSIHPSQLFWLSTIGSAKALKQEDKIGNLKKGLFADLIILDLNPAKFLSKNMTGFGDFWSDLFRVIMMGDERNVKDVWVSGNPIISKTH